jgi:hypothetical protein
MPDIPKTIDDLIGKLPENLQPVAEEYGPALLEMSAKEIWAWVNLLLNLEYEKAYKTLLSRMNQDDIMKEWEAKIEKWKQANAENAAAIMLQKNALMAVLDAALQIAFVALTGVPLI